MPFVDLTVVVPTREEAATVSALLGALNRVLQGLRAEVVVVDDSDDETPAAVEEAADRLDLPVRLCHRPRADRIGGLGGAVKWGFEVALGRYVAVMDADFQHPPELVPALLAEAERTGAEVVVASRFADGGGVGEFEPIRQLISRSCSWLARLLFPRRLRSVSDPLSGFFLVRRDRLRPELLMPQGFKILLEVLLRSQPLRVAEVPYTFGQRAAGESKASLREGVRYLKHLILLRFHFGSLRLLKFGAVGGTGLVVNTLLLMLLTQSGMWYLVSAAIATEAAIVWNYALSEIWVFRSRSGRKGSLRRFACFAAMNNTAFALSGPLLWLLVSAMGVQYLLANLLSILVLMVARFAISDMLIWRTSASELPEGSTSPRRVREAVALATALTSGPARSP